MINKAVFGILHRPTNKLVGKTFRALSNASARLNRFHSGPARKDYCILAFSLDPAQGLVVR